MMYPIADAASIAVGVPDGFSRPPPWAPQFN